MTYFKVTPEIVSKLKAIIGVENVIISKEGMEDYSHDELSPDWIKSYPEAVVKPMTTEHISQIIKLAAKEKIPVTARGGATGLTGGCIPVKGGISLSLEKMKKVLEIDKENMMATVEAGISLSEFYKEIEKYDLYFPPHPGAESAHIGGVIATNAGGSRAVKYGIIRNFVKGLEVVMANGDIIQIGGKLVKNSTGYNLLNLIIGSEGTLCVITKATISLIPPPKALMTLIIPYKDLHEAIKTIPLLMENNIIPMAVEFLEKDVLFLTEKYLDLTWPSRQGNADLMIILDGDTEEEIMRTAEKISGICLANKAMDVLVADNKEKQAEILKIRSEIYEAIKIHTIEVLDVCVPRSNVALLVDKIHQVEKKYNVWLPTFGHAADGNVHTHIMKAKRENNVWTEAPEKVWKSNHLKILEDIYAAGKELNGVISGEHGIGLVKKDHLASSIGEKQVEVMRSVKKALDPESILNPGKIFDM
jgi:glycolate oxidase